MAKFNPIKIYNPCFVNEGSGKDPLVYAAMFRAAKDTAKKLQPLGPEYLFTYWMSSFVNAAKRAEVKLAHLLNGCTGELPDKDTLPMNRAPDNATAHLEVEYIERVYLDEDDDDVGPAYATNVGNNYVVKLGYLLLREDGVWYLTCLTVCQGLDSELPSNANTSVLETLSPILNTKEEVNVALCKRIEELRSLKKRIDNDKGFEHSNINYW